MTMRRHGFTLLEMSIVLLIIGVVVGAGAFMLTESLQQKQIDETKAKMAHLQKTILDYRRTYNRLPCPAFQTAATDAAAYGTENCGGAPPDLYGSGPVLSGMVPTKTLGLPDEYALDGWGRRMVYTIHTNYVAANAFLTIPVTDGTALITVRNAAGNPKTTMAVYVLLSYGKNGHGAFPRKGGTARVQAKSAQGTSGSVNVDELQNCHCTQAAAAALFDIIFVQKLPTQTPGSPQDSFDDIVTYQTRVDLRSATE